MTGHGQLEMDRWNFCKAGAQPTNTPDATKREGPKIYDPLNYPVLSGNFQESSIRTSGNQKILGWYNLGVGPYKP